MRIGALSPATQAPFSQMVMLGEYGHGIGGPGITEAEWREFQRRMGDGNGDPQWYDLFAMNRLPPGVEEQLGPLGVRSFGHPNIFPNLWIALTNQICLRLPRSPDVTELWWFTIMPKALPEERKRAMISFANRLFTPAGLLEQDDGENWSHSTRGARGKVAQRYPMNLTMGMGRDEVIHEAGQSAIQTVVNEHGQRWTYRSWQEWLQAEDWGELIADHSMPPTGVV